MLTPPSTNTTIGQPDNNSALTIPQYWEKFGKKIEKMRGWISPKTFLSYDQKMKKLAPELPDTPICKVTFFELMRAVQGVRFKAAGGKPYSKASLNGFFTVLADIFLYAQAHGDADNIVMFCQTRARDKNDPFSNLFDASLSPEEQRDKAEQLLEEHPYKIKFLSKRQLLELNTLISNGIREDGRSVAMAIFLYCGLRPSECRALQWGDIRPFHDHPDRRMFVLRKTQGKKGQTQNQMKTPNAYRYMPIHCELDQFLKQRYEYVKSNLSLTEKEINKLPICCYFNHFDQYCEDYQLSSFGTNILNQLKFTKDELGYYMANMLIDDVDVDPEEGPKNLFLYVLRRNFCSWGQGMTQLDEMQRNYLMGHSMRVGKLDLRQQYNGEDELFRMLMAMDKAVLNGDYNRSPYYYELLPDTSIDIVNQGHVLIHIPQPCDGYAYEISIVATAAEPDSPILVAFPDSTDGRRIPKIWFPQTSSLVSSEILPPLNTECDEWDAWKAVRSRAKVSTKDPDGTLAESE